MDAQPNSCFVTASKMHPLAEIRTAPPSVSVVMPCFNAARHLCASVTSALAQSFADFELIVVDDGSTDDTPAILASVDDPRVRVHTQPNRGVCAARNAGLALARGQFVAFLDADDTWDADCLRELHAALELSGATLAYCGWQNVGLPGSRGLPFVPPDYEDNSKLLNLFDNCRWPIHACLTRRDAIVAAGGFDPRFKTSEDYLLWLKIGKSHPIMLVPRVLAFYHFHDGGQATQDRAGIAINHFRAQRAFLDDFPGDARRIPPEARWASMEGRLVQRGLECYWKRDLAHARPIFRTLLREGHVKLPLLKYMLPALLPLPLHEFLVRRRDGRAPSNG